MPLPRRVLGGVFFRITVAKYGSESRMRFWLKEYIRAMVRRADFLKVSCFCVGFFQEKVKFDFSTFSQVFPIQNPADQRLQK